MFQGDARWKRLRYPFVLLLQLGCGGGILWALLALGAAAESGETRGSGRPISDRPADKPPAEPAEQPAEKPAVEPADKPADKPKPPTG